MRRLNDVYLSPITPRERVLKAIAHQEADCIPLQDSFWEPTINRWRGEGLPKDVNLNDYFGFSMCGVWADTSPRYEVRTVEETAEYIVETTSRGGTIRRHRDHSTTPEILDWGIKTREDWAKAKRRLTPSKDRVDWEAMKKTYAEARAKGLFVTYGDLISYDLCQSYIRTDELLPLLLTDPDWIRDMAETQTDLVIEMTRLLIAEGLKPDALFCNNDMGYSRAPLFSPRVYREVYKPADKRLFEFAHSQGLPMLIHSCGYVKPFVPDMLAIGLDCLQPLEVKAGMDLVELKREYGKDLAFMGGIDVRAMAHPDPAVIECEIATKIPVAKVGGGYVYHSDHSVPPNVSFAQYYRILELVRHYGQYESTR